MHTGIAGWAWGITLIVGGSITLDISTSLRGWVVVAAVSILAFAIGLWASDPDTEDVLPPLRDRWLLASSLTALAAIWGTLAPVYSNAFPSIPWKIGGLLLGVAAPAYALGRIPVRLITSARDLDEDGEDPTDLERFVTGLFMPAFLVGFAAAILVMVLAIPDEWNRGSVMILATFSLLLPFLLRVPAMSRSYETQLAEVGSPLGVWTVTEVDYPGERQPERRLYLNDEQESGELVRGGTPTLAYVAAAEQWLVSSTPAGAAYLFLGGGAYTLPRRIAERDASAEVCVVELDPEATRLAQRFFGLKPHLGIRTVHGDARAFLETAEPASFDRVFMDVYGGSEITPYPLVTRDAALLIAGILRPGGVMGMNLIGTLAGKSAVRFWSVVRTFADVFPFVELWTHRGQDFPDAQNFLLIASMQEIRPVVVPGTFELWPREEWQVEEDTVVFHDLSQPARSSTPRSRT